MALKQRIIAAEFFIDKGVVMAKSMVMAVLALTLTACQSDTPPASSTTPAASRPAAQRVFFVRPKNGETIKPLTTIEFGNEGVTIAAVPQGTITPDQVRPGMTHYHLGVDTDCLPAGTEIPKADPWIHFGQGNNTIEISLTPGPHRLTLQSGDDMHRTLPGLCETINVTVAP
jgi:hypothetical protein